MPIKNAFPNVHIGETMQTNIPKNQHSNPELATENASAFQLFRRPYTLPFLACFQR